MSAKINDIEIKKGLSDPATRRATFTKVMNTYQKPLYWHIRKMVINHADADDILQNTFIKAWKNIERFRGDASISTWLYRIATNASMDHFNSAHNRYTSKSAEVEEVLATTLAKDEYFTGDEIELKLQKALLQLPEKQRIVFNMRYYDETPYKEMSEILDTSEGALKASYHHAAKKIEAFLLNND